MEKGLPNTGATLTIADNSNEPIQSTHDLLPSSNRGWSIGERILTPLYGAICLALLICWLFHAYIYFKNPVQVDYGEGVVTHFSLAMFHGAPIYTDHTKPPYWIFPYMPLQPWLQSKLLTTLPAIAAGRILSQSSITLLCIGLAVYLRRFGWRTAFIGVAVFLADPVVLTFGCFVRPDALALGLAGIGLLIADRSETLWRDLLCAALLVMALFTKQSYWAAPLAVFFSRWREGKGLLRFALCFGSIYGASLATAGYLTGGELIKTLTNRTLLGYSVDQAAQMITDYLPFVMVPLAIVLPRLRQAPAIWQGFFAFSFVMVVGIGRFGAIHNYFLELHLALAVLTAWSYQSWERRPAGLDTVTIGHIILPAGLIGIGYFTSIQGIYLNEFKPWQSDTPPPVFGPAYLHHNMLKPLMDSRPQTIMSENSGAVVLYGHPLVYFEPSTYLGLIEQKAYDETPILELLDKGFVDIIILDSLNQNLRFSPKFLEHTRNNYLEVVSAPGMHVLVPKGQAAKYYKIISEGMSTDKPKESTQK